MTEAKSRVRELEERLQQKEKVISVLMKRVEREISEKGTAYDSFVAAAILEKKVNQRTQELSRALSVVEQQTAEVEKNWLYLRNLLDNIDDFISIISREKKLLSPIKGLLIWPDWRFKMWLVIICGIRRGSVALMLISAI